ncbi:MAG: NADH-quinone oxidoreductase subunit J [Proteobacteria bacterium]|nr:NADH-quinone oxidoreductase subunit J [Pseudomonadota bacterium]
MNPIPISMLIFYLFAGIAVLSAIMVIASNNPVRGVLFLVVTFIASSGMWMMAQAEFLSLILVLVYVGAVMTLFLFVVMMINIELTSQKRKFSYYLPFGAGIILLLVLMMLIALHPQYFSFGSMPSGVLPKGANTELLGKVLYTNYAYPFIVAGVLLLTAIIAAISLVHRRPRDCKSQQVTEQIKTRRELRVRIVNLPSEKKED